MRLFVVCMLVAAMSTLVSALQAVEIIAHRGASYDAPENTIASFYLGWQQKADAGELDLQLTQDGQIVVIHDLTLKRTAGLDAPVADCTLAQLRALDAGIWKGPAWKGEKLPTLREALATIPDNRRMFIEIKCGPGVLSPLQADIQGSAKQPGQGALIGFKYETMLQAKRCFPQLQVYWIVSNKTDKKSKKPLEPPRLETLIEKAKAAKFDGLDLDARLPIDARWIAQIRAAGLRLFVWTVDDPAVAARLIALGVDGITTNRPGWLREQLQ
jgi:glycerophosphoryl diester phosphodiesterase